VATLSTNSAGAAGETAEWALYLIIRRTLSYSPIDGVFGTETRIPVEQFQRDSHLAVDDIFGPATWGARRPRAAGGTGRAFSWAGDRTGSDRAEVRTRLSALPPSESSLRRLPPIERQEMPYG